MALSVGYIGLGAMGGALASRLLKSRDTWVWDLNQEASARLGQIGARVAPTAADLARQCQIIFLCLPRSQDVHDLIFGTDGMLTGFVPGTIIIDQTSGAPDQARTIATALASRGVQIIDAPVAGGVPAAQAGQITMMVSGPPDVVDRVLPVLHEISPNVIHCGGRVGDGHAIKIINNMMNAVLRITLLECISMARKLGLPLQELAQTINQSPACSRLSQIALLALLEGRSSTDFGLPLMLKDVNQAVVLGRSVGAPLPLVSLSRGILELGVNRLGPNSRLEDMIAFIAEMAGTTLNDLPKQTEVASSDRKPMARLIVQTLESCNQMAAYEAIALAEKINLGMDHLAAVIDKGTGWSRTFESIMAVHRNAAPDEATPLNDMTESLSLSCELAFSVHAPMLMANTVRNNVQAIANELGGEASIKQVMQLFIRRAGSM